VLTGGGGADSLLGEAGSDTHNSQDGGTADTNDCGADTDTANADIQDSTTNCETVANPAPGQPGGPPVTPPPPPPPTLPADTKAPELLLGGKTKQKNKKQIKVEVTTDEASSVEVTGTIKIPALKAKGRKVPLAKSKKFELKPASASVAADQTQKLKLKLSGKAKKLLKKAIKRKASKAKLSATATDAAGNASNDSLSVKVKK
jgi:hypothetical protein